MARRCKKIDKQRCVYFDGNQANLSEVIAAASTIKGVKIEKKAGITRIYIPKQSPPPSPSRIVKVFHKGKPMPDRVQKDSTSNQHYCAIMLK